MGTLRRSFVAYGCGYGRANTTPEARVTDVPPDREVDDAVEEADDAGGRGGGSPHTSPEEGHPAGEGPRSDRDIGGPTAPDEGDGEATGGAPGTRGAPFEPHE